MTMMYPLLPQTQFDGGAKFKCNNMNQEMSVAACLKWFVDHNALNRKESPCFKCTQGKDNRECFSRS